MPVALLADIGESGIEADEELADDRRQRVAGGRQPQRSSALEQTHAPQFLQMLDLMADRALGDMELGRRGGERRVAGRRLEGTQGRAGRQVSHRISRLVAIMSI